MSLITETVDAVNRVRREVLDLDPIPDLVPGLRDKPCACPIANSLYFGMTDEQRHRWYITVGGAITARDTDRDDAPWVSVLPAYYEVVPGWDYVTRQYNFVTRFDDCEDYERYEKYHPLSHGGF